MSGVLTERPIRRPPFSRTLVLAALGLRALALFGLPSPVLAQESLADIASFREGCQALVDERFETAVARFRECWDLVRDAESGGPESNFVAARLIEALVRDGASSSAVAWLLENEGFQPTPATSYWLAAAFQAEDRFAEAADYYQIHLAATPDASSGTVINRAACLARSGQTDAAFDLVHNKIQPSSAAETLQLAQIAAAAARSTEALTYLQNVDSSSPEWKGLRLSLARLRCSLQSKRGDRRGALETIYGTITSSTSGDDARRAFLLLESFLAGERPSDLDENFTKWRQDETFPGSESAAFFRIVLLEDEPARSESLRTFAASSKDPALKLEAVFRLEDLSGSETLGGDLPGDLLERIEYANASKDYRAAKFNEAAKRFSEIAGKGSGESAARNHFNAAVSSLRADDATSFAAFEKALAQDNPHSILLADLSYLGGLFFAAKGQPAAFDRLNRFVQEHPGHRANVDAQLALAEIHLNQAPARPHEAREIFEGLRTRPLTLAQSERLDYSSVWVELADGDGAALLHRAGEFVANWPSSEYLGEVLMILASEQYSRRNFSAASAAFLRVSQEFPDSPYSETARFFEAKASPASDETVAKWHRLVEAKGLLAKEASHELGLLFLSLDRFEEAQNEFTSLLDLLDPDSALRFAVMADLAYALYLEALAEGRDPAKLSEAADRFATLSNLDAAPALWRYNAAVRRGKCLEALGKTSIALEIYRSIVDETRSGKDESTSSLAPEETEWVFRAGFAAIEILNSEKNWAAAIEVADTLSEKSGPRAIEATRLAERLRLKHWVWD